MRASWLVIFVLGCEVAPVAVTEPVALDSASGAQEAGAEEAGAADGAVGEPPIGTSACVRIGLDLRALPQPVDESSIAMFVGYQVMQVQEQTAGPPPQIWVQRGVGGMFIAYGADGETSAMARCEAGVARYLETAPTLPLIMEPAATVTTPCEPCTIP